MGKTGRSCRGRGRTQIGRYETTKIRNYILPLFLIFCRFQSFFISTAVPSKTLHFPSPRHLTSLYGGREENLVHAERALGAKLVTREDWVKIDGPPEKVAAAEALFTFLDKARSQGMSIRTPDFHRISDAFARGEGGQ